MTRQEALKEVQRRWPVSNLHNAYESMIRAPGSYNETILYHVCCYNPNIHGVGGSWEAAFADADASERRARGEGDQK